MRKKQNFLTKCLLVSLTATVCAGLLQSAYADPTADTSRVTTRGVILNEQVLRERHNQIAYYTVHLWDIDVSRVQVAPGHHRVHPDDMWVLDMIAELNLNLRLESPRINPDSEMTRFSSVTNQIRAPYSRSFSHFRGFVTPLGNISMRSDAEADRQAEATERHQIEGFQRAYNNYRDNMQFLVDNLGPEAPYPDIPYPFVTYVMRRGETYHYSRTSSGRIRTYQGVRTPIGVYLENESWLFEKGLRATHLFPEMRGEERSFNVDRGERAPDSPERVNAIYITSDRFVGDFILHPFFHIDFTIPMGYVPDWLDVSLHETFDFWHIHEGQWTYVTIPREYFLSLLPLIYPWNDFDSRFIQPLNLDDFRN